MPVSSAQFGQTPWQYANGLRISYNSTTKLNVALGSCLDSTGVYQITLPANAVINSGTVGLNGIDTGVLTASTVYAVYVVADPVTQQATGCMISTSLTGPLMPFGYSAYKLIGFITTNSGTNFLLGYWSDTNTSQRLFMYDAPQATAVTAGAQTSYTAIDLSALVPAVTLTPVYINSAFTPDAAGHTLKLQPTGATGDAITITGQVASVVVTTQSLLFSEVVSGKSEISYVVANGSDAAAINVAGYLFYI